ncbi:unnamed protein product [Fusarium venenatum]|uniref:Uncharacterized protein n=1 Tax=Fusarium venenatum TaxID=56646 RepID=A0A2L2TWW6_9HYPO|nr:uncharacterized protein FVRRES_01607 [Fusarium venenatum]CEI65095.1 unnamed protein product [Fusarium venenatum]
MLEIKTNERAKIYQRARAHDITLCWALTPHGPGHVRHSEGVRAKSEPGGAELPRRGRFGDSADNDAVRSLGLDPAGAHSRPGMNCGLQGRLGTIQYSTLDRLLELHLEVFALGPDATQYRGITHQPGPGKSHEPRHEGDSNTTTLRELFVPFALLAQLAPRL